jgi:hypothetical protein
MWLTSAARQITSSARGCHGAHSLLEVPTRQSTIVRTAVTSQWSGVGRGATCLETRAPAPRRAKRSSSNCCHRVIESCTQAGPNMLDVGLALLALRTFCEARESSVQLLRLLFVASYGSASTPPSALTKCSAPRSPCSAAERWNLAAAPRLPAETDSTISWWHMLVARSSEDRRYRSWQRLAPNGQPHCLIWRIPFGM